MGIFKKFTELTAEIGKTINEAADKVELTRAPEPPKAAQAAASRPARPSGGSGLPYRTSSDPVIVYNTAPGIDELRSYFTGQILEAAGPVDVERDVHVAVLTDKVPYRFAIIDLLIYEGGRPRLAILLTSKNKYRNACYVNTMAACEQAGVPCIRFMTEFRNEPEYVRERIRQELGL